MLVSSRGPVWAGWLSFLIVVGLGVGCDATLPSERFRSAIRLPVPAASRSQPIEERLSRAREADVYELSARSLIPIAFNLQPDIKSSFRRFKSEEARYDFFVVSRDSLTPTLRTSNTGGETRTGDTVSRDRNHKVELGVEKRFFDTTELNVGVGYETDIEDSDVGNAPFLSADLRYPLWASREKLERTSEEIFRRNELNDAQLAYIQQVRSRLQRAMFIYQNVTDLIRVVEHTARWQRDLRSLTDRIEAVRGRDVSSDLRRCEAENSRVNSQLRNSSGRLEVDTARLKAACGIPLYARVEIVPEPFNPFEGQTHEELFRLSIATDPEIRTLRNEVNNSEAELDLARRGRWDIALLAAGQAGLEGRGRLDGDSDWSVSVGFEVSRVDARVTQSLIQQAEARIVRFTEAIAARENAVFVDTLEPLIRIDTLSTSRDELSANLPRFEEDYAAGLREYFAGRLNIDDLLKRRETLWNQQVEISGLTEIVGFNVAELCTATGKFFELLDVSGGSDGGE